MESGREPLSAVRPRTTGGDPAGLCDAWRRRSLASGWMTAEDWHSEAVDAAAARGTGALSPAETHRLLIVCLPRRPGPWRGMALAIVVGHELRAAFPGRETLSLARQNGAGLPIALVRARADLPTRYARLPGALRLVDELTP